MPGWPQLADHSWLTFTQRASVQGHPATRRGRDVHQETQPLSTSFSGHGAITSALGVPCYAPDAITPLLLQRPRCICFFQVLAIDYRHAGHFVLFVWDATDAEADLTR